MNWVSAYSAASGFAVGFAAAWFVAWWHERQRAAEKLRRLLFDIGNKLYSDSGHPFAILDPVYLELMDAVWGYHRFCAPWEKVSFLKLGYSLIGHDPATKSRHCHAYPDSADACDITERLLTAIGCDYPAYMPFKRSKQ